MEYSMDTVANKVIMVIVGLSFLISAGGYFFFMSRDNTAAAFPFAAGVLMAMGLNIAKVILMKQAVNNAVKREALAAKIYLQQQYFLRLVITCVVFLTAGWLHANVTDETGNPRVVNFIGTVFGIFTFPVAMYSMRFFLRKELKDAEPLESDKSTSIVQDSINELKAIGAEPAAVNNSESPKSLDDNKKVG